MEELKLILATVEKLGGQARVVFIIWCLKEIAHLPLLACALYWIVRGALWLINQSNFGTQIRQAGGYKTAEYTPDSFEKYMMRQAGKWRDKDDQKG